MNVTVYRQFYISGGSTIVVGSVGSGKSSLLQAMLCELTLVDGHFLGRYSFSHFHAICVSLSLNILLPNCM